MRIILILFVCFAIIFASSEHDKYLLKNLNANEITAIIEILSASKLPAKINENITLKSIKSNNNALNAFFVIDNPHDKLKQELENMARDEICKNNILRELSQKQVVYVGKFYHDEKNLFDIVLDSCD
ncbi:hypothetical protein LMG7974_00229 [Campylobacter majalis]|uniref:Uncharacterized protein n=1 Tax=Campylobacter majalis TaxID=2790656 RepID=A0ABN7K470_9BACT|nr:hypothetical protein [Campylobacter majalis]CAD7287304.1 hypothetical protein LMG7974_00229 [Campylobacter majalis]